MKHSQKHYSKMKKIIYIFALVAFVLVSCEKTVLKEMIITQSETNRLVFNSRDEVIQAIQELDNKNECDILLKNPDFISFSKAKATRMENDIQKIKLNLHDKY